MKKILGLLTALLLSAVAFAGSGWNNYLGFGWRIPTGTSLTVTEDGLPDDTEINMPLQTGIDFSYTGVNSKNGLSARAMADFNVTTSDITGLDGENISGFNMDFLLGLGWAPIHSKSLVLGIYGIAGMDIVSFQDSSSTDTVASSKISTKNNWGYAAFIAGGNATLIWAPLANRFSIFASVTMGYNFPSSVKKENETKTTILGNTTTTTSSSSVDVSGAFKFIPSICVSWRF